MSPTSTAPEGACEDLGRTRIEGEELQTAHGSRGRASHPAVAGGFQMVKVARSLSPGAAAALAREIRTATGGLNSAWPHLMLFGSSPRLVELVRLHMDMIDTRRET